MTNGLLIGSPDWVREWRKMKDEEPKEGYGIKHAPGTCCPDKTLHVVCTGCDHDYGSIQSEITRAKEEHEHCFCKYTDELGSLCCQCGKSSN